MVITPLLPGREATLSMTGGDRVALKGLKKKKIYGLSNLLLKKQLPK